MIEIKNLLGKPLNIYHCNNNFYEIWEYCYELLQQNNRFLVFKKNNLLYEVIRSLEYYQPCE